MIAKRRHSWRSGNVLAFRLVASSESTQTSDYSGVSIACDISLPRSITTAMLEEHAVLQLQVLI